MAKVNTKSKPKSAYELKMLEAISRHQAVQEQKAIKQLDNLEVVNSLLEQQDDIVLDGLLQTLEKAYSKPIYAINFNGSSSKLIAICNALTFAPKGVRELIPASMYTLLNDRIRDSIIENSGRFPYYRKPVELEMSDGTTRIFDEESSVRAMQGEKANLEKLNASLFLASMSLNLQADVEVTSQAYDREWSRALSKAQKEATLAEVLEEAVA